MQHIRYPEARRQKHLKCDCLATPRLYQLQLIPTWDRSAKFMLAVKVKDCLATVRSEIWMLLCSTNQDRSVYIQLNCREPFSA